MCLMTTNVTPKNGWEDWRHGSSEFEPQSHQKKKKKKPGDIAQWYPLSIHEALGSTPCTPPKKFIKIVKMVHFMLFVFHHRYKL
jgi:hypothetical protein